MNFDPKPFDLKIVGATIVSIGTTTPECAVSVMAAWGGEPGLALGNAIGSIICDTALVFGLCCALALIPKDRFILNRHGWLTLRYWCQKVI